MNKQVVQMQILPGRNKQSVLHKNETILQQSLLCSSVRSLSPDSSFHCFFPSAKDKNSKSCVLLMIAELQSNDSPEEQRFCEVINLTNQVRSGTLYSPQ